LRGAVLPLLLNLTSVRRAPLRLGCFAVSDAIESTSTLTSLLARHYVRGLMSQVKTKRGREDVYYGFRIGDKRGVKG
jgi:hypothetical protein